MTFSQQMKQIVHLTCFNSVHLIKSWQKVQLKSVFFLIIYVFFCSENTRALHPSLAEIKNGTGSESRRRLGNRRVGRQPNARFFRAERGLALQRKAQSLIRPMETHQINNYLEVERADLICWEKFERQFVEKVIFKNLEHSWHFCSMLG